ncbi:MAG: DCC1-like thiol-disulfide oxidoreductase, partial [Bacteroidota bacterium]
MKLILYDGTCNLCHWAVQWVKKNAAPSTYFQFESLESDFGKKIIEKYSFLEGV